jgi:anti-anti-sigma factor
VDQLRVSVSGGDAYTVVALAGESDVYTYDQLRSALEAEATRGVPLLIVDLSALEFMDSSGVQVLLDIRVMMNDRGGKLALAGPQNTVARVLNLVGADQLIPVYPSVEEAVGTPLTLRRNTAHAAPEHRSRSAGTPPVTQPAPHRGSGEGPVLAALPAGRAAEPDVLDERLPLSRGEHQLRSIGVVLTVPHRHPLNTERSHFDALPVIAPGALPPWSAEQFHGGRIV